MSRIIFLAICPILSVIPGRSGAAAEGKGIQGRRAHPWIPFPRLRRAGDDGRDYNASRRHREERSDAAIHLTAQLLGWIASPPARNDGERW